MRILQDLRLIERDGKQVLQAKWLYVHRANAAFSPLRVDDNRKQQSAEWHDVRLETGEPYPFPKEED